MLPLDFQFSQGSLQDFVDCPRRFQLRYVRRLRWPSVEAQPVLENERRLRQGAALHRLIRQHLMGIPVDALSRRVSDPDVRRWWRNYQREGPAAVPSELYPEVMLGTRVGDYRLVARYDLVAVDAGRRAVIVDWKTNRRRPRRAWLSERLQTQVYPYVLVQGMDQLEGGRGIEPDSVSLLYWFANFPSEPERFRYDGSQFRASRRRLARVIDEIVHRIGQASVGELMPRTEDEDRCRICRYRSLCGRGVEAGWVDESQEEPEAEDPFGFDIDFEQIAELAVG